VSAAARILRTTVGEHGTVWFFFLMFDKVIVEMIIFYINRYLPILLNPICAILKSFDVNFQFGTNRIDSPKQRGKNNPVPPAQVIQHFILPLSHRVGVGVDVPVQPERAARIGMCS
jgi:hypothetical protein